MSTVLPAERIASVLPARGDGNGETLMFSLSELIEQDPSLLRELQQLLTRAPEEPRREGPAPEPSRWFATGWTILRDGPGSWRDRRIASIERYDEHTYSWSVRRPSDEAATDSSCASSTEAAMQAAEAALQPQEGE